MKRTSQVGASMTAKDAAAASIESTRANCLMTSPDQNSASTGDSDLGVCRISATDALGALDR
jgi:hypothetical protein